jgi:hypothetical protein
MTRSFQLALCCLAVAGCGNSLLAPLEHDILSDAALDRTIERDTSAPVQTDSLVHHLTRQAPWYSVEIPFRYRNDTGRTISIVNCQGGLNIGLEKRVGAEWQTFYQPVLLMCLSPPIHIAPGETFARAARIMGAIPGHDAGPEFASSDLDGEYRLVWSNLVHDYRDTGQSFGQPVGPLRSNPFLLVAPGAAGQPSDR